ncbi:Hypothetical protein KVN_LOCUS211 [uncultured virus]|nr:Hypothetical protein KVN_LOCUS211 [uncultured virus]
MDHNLIDFILENRNNISSNLKEIFNSSIDQSIKFKFDSIEINYMNNNNILEYLSFSELDECDEDYGKWDENFLVASNNSITQSIWENIISNKPPHINHIFNISGKNRTTKIGFSDLDRSLINLLKKELPSCKITINFSIYDKEVENGKWMNASVTKISELIKTKLIPNEKQIKLFCKGKTNSVEFIGTINKGFNIETTNDEEFDVDDLKNDYFHFSVETSSLLLCAWFKTELFRNMIKNLINNIDDINDEENIKIKLNNEKSIYCFTDPNKDMKIDYNKFLTHLNIIFGYIDNLAITPCAHLGITI